MAPEVSGEAARRGGVVGCRALLRYCALPEVHVSGAA